MKLHPITWAAAFLGTLAIANADPQADLDAALAKLKEAENYSFTTSSTFGGNSDRVTRGSGKATKDGLIHYTSSFGDNTVEFYKKGENGALKGDEGWRSLAEIRADRENAGEGGGGQGRGGRGFGTRGIESLVAPAQQAADLAGKTEGLEAADGVITGKLTAEAVQELSAFGGRRRGGGGGGGGGQDRPAPSDASGTVKFWIQDGAITKFETHTSATFNFNGEDRTVERTSTTEISKVGESPVEVPADAAAKLES
jgi:hypothetical protein